MLKLEGKSMKREELTHLVRVDGDTHEWTCDDFLVADGFLQMLDDKKTIGVYAPGIWSWCLSVKAQDET